MTAPYDAILVFSFGGPEHPDEVMPFLESVTRGRGVPRDRLLAVATHYQQFGGRSPINEQNRALVAALREALVQRGMQRPVYLGNRHAKPHLADTLAAIRADGHRRVLAFVTSSFGSYSGCRAYREDLDRARTGLGEPGLEVDILRKHHNHPLFIDAVVDRAQAAKARLGDAAATARLVFTAHSIPVAMARTSPYESQLRDAAGLVAERLGTEAWDLVWQSRSGPPQVPWLEPDVLDHLRATRAAGTESVLLVPLGFVSDHMEVVYDLDTEARNLARSLGLRLERAQTVGTHPHFVDMIVELIREREAGAERRSLGVLGPAPDHCAPGCCPAATRPPSERPPSDRPPG
ncbi:MAG: ferrochelatase [Polyangiales bacterium]|nr:ferrochelatase [Myxococcales bacterium]